MIEEVTTPELTGFRFDIVGDIESSLFKFLIDLPLGMLGITVAVQLAASVIVNLPLLLNIDIDVILIRFCLADRTADALQEPLERLTALRAPIFCPNSSPHDLHLIQK